MSHTHVKVGISLYVRQGQQSLWENGIFQNCYFLADLMSQSPAVSEVYIVNGGDGDIRQASEFLTLSPAPVIGLDEAMTQLDVMIEFSAQLDPSWATEFRSRGGRVIGMRVANDYAIDVERMVFDKPQGLLISGTPYDEIWTLPAFEATCRAYYEVAQRAPVRVVPHLWSPRILEHGLLADGRQRSFEYQRGWRPWTVGIVEPNVCLVKTSFIGLLIADLVHRDVPSAIRHVHALNTFHFLEHPGFIGFCRDLDIVKHGIASFEARAPIYDVLGGGPVDVVVSHSLENEQNYLYYEALYGGYPLIHNSNFLDGCGYRYDAFDCREGAHALRQAMAMHDTQLDAYQARARQFLEKLHPHAPGNVEIYTEALTRVVGQGERHAESPKAPRSRDRQRRERQESALSQAESTK